MPSKRVMLRSGKIWKHRWHYRCPKCHSQLQLERDGVIKYQVKDAVHPTRYCEAQHCDPMTIMTFDAGASEFSAVWAPGGLQLKTDIDAQNFAVSVFKPSIVGGNFVLVEETEPQS